MSKRIKFKTEEERRVHRRKYLRQYYKRNREKMIAYQIGYNRQVREREREADDRFFGRQPA